MSRTPNGSQIVAVSVSGSVTDVTEAVKAVYDLVLSSMDWGSGFITEDDALPVARLAEVCGFEEHDEIKRYLEAQRHSKEQGRFQRKHQQEYGNYTSGAWPRAHEHVFSSIGKCMWPGCSGGAEQPR